MLFLPQHTGQDTGLGDPSTHVIPYLFVDELCIF